MAHQQLVKPRLRYLARFIGIRPADSGSLAGSCLSLCPIRRDVKLAIPTRFQPPLSALESYYYSNFPGDACWPTLIKRIFGDTERRLEQIKARFN